MGLPAMPFSNNQVMHELDYELYHFYDSAPSNVTLHHHDFFEFYFLIDGSMDYLVEGNRFTLLPGDLLLISPKNFHCPDADDRRYERYVLWFSIPYLAMITKDNPGFLPFLLQTDVSRRKLRLSEGDRTLIHAMLATLLGEENRRDPTGKQFAESMLSSLMLLIYRRLTSEMVPKNKNGKMPKDKLFA